MAWVDGYQQGEYKGVPFFLKSHTYGSGRDITAHKFPGRDDRYNEDTGRSERSFRLSLYVLGDDYFAQRDRLKDALEGKGPGRLVNPYTGIFSVVVRDFSFTESTEEGRIATFEVSFTEDTPVALTVATRNTPRAVADARTALYSAVQDDFVSKYPAKFTLPPVLKTVQDAVGKSIAAVDKAKSTVASVAEYRRKVDSFTGKIQELTLDAQSLAREVRSIVDWGVDPFSSLYKPTPENSRQIFRDMENTILSMSAPWDIAADTTGGDTAELVRQYSAASATCSAVGVVATYPLETVAEAEALRAAVFSMLDTLQGSPTVSEDVFDTAADAKRAIQDDLSRRILSLSVTIDYKTPESEPVLAIANEIYGDISRSEEIIARNNIRHPGFSPAAEPLKIQVSQ